MSQNPHFPTTWDLKPGDFENYALNEIKNGIFLFFTLFVLPFLQSKSLLVSFCFTLNASCRFQFTVHSYSILRDLSTPMFLGNEVGIVSRFPSNIRRDKFCHFQHGFFNIASYYLNCLAISRFSD